HALRELANDRLSLLLFPVKNPEVFDAVSTDADGRVQTIEVKASRPRSHWIWGAFKMPGGTLHALHRLWRERAEKDEYFGTLINALGPWFHNIILNAVSTPFQLALARIPPGKASRVAIANAIAIPTAPVIEKTCIGRLACATARSATGIGFRAIGPPRALQ